MGCGQPGSGQPSVLGGCGSMSRARLGARPAALFSEELKPFQACSSSPWVHGGFGSQGQSVPSDCTGPALSETINRCLRKYLEQLKAPVGPLSEALGNLHLDSSPGESDVAPGSVPEETPVTGSCRLKCVCYGVGNFATCIIARNQLAFLLLFLEKCQVNFGILLYCLLPWSCAHRC